MSKNKKTPVKKAAKAATPKLVAKPRNDSVEKVAKAVAASPTPPPFDARADALARQKACTAEVNDVLAKHRCYVKSALNPPEVIGGEPMSKMMVSSTWGILPEA